MASDVAILLLGLLSVTVVAVKLLRRRRSRKSVAIVVLGDIGRSPRMLYHAGSFVERGYKTYIVAYRGSTPPPSLVGSPHAVFVYLPTPLAFVSKLPKPLFLLLSPIKVVAGATALFWALVYRLDSTPEFLFIQNPPSIPTLPIVKLATLLRPSKIIIDWHNTGYSVLSMRLGSRSPVVRLAKWIEMYFGRTAEAHLCVTEAMRQNLVSDARLEGHATVLHDRPPSHFRRQSLNDALKLLTRLPDFTGDSSLTSNLFFERSGELASDRPALLVSATSWTADEDFSILLSALSQYNKAATTTASSSSGRLPAVVVVITGKGAGKAAFEEQVRELETEWNYVRVRTAWLPLEDYPRFLGCADLGISLHTSTSGADLPMKVVDMFGCQLPVCALDFACISELVQDGINGKTFRNAQELAYLLMTLLRDFPADTNQLDRLSSGIAKADYAGGKWCTWEENWERLVVPLLTPM